MRIKVKDIQAGMKIKANIWGLSKTEGREVLTVAPCKRGGGVSITIAGWADPIGLSANTRIDL